MCPRRRSPAGIHGQPRFVPMPGRVVGSARPEQSEGARPERHAPAEASQPHAAIGLAVRGGPIGSPIARTGAPAASATREDGDSNRASWGRTPAGPHGQLRSSGGQSIRDPKQEVSSQTGITHSMPSRYSILGLCRTGQLLESTALRCESPCILLHFASRDGARRGTSIAALL
jgi:hypothetical protein